MWFESTVERVASRKRDGSVGTILGPFHLPGQVELASPAVLPMRPEESGERLVLTGTVCSAAGPALPGAVLDVWHADAEGLYSGFAPDLPQGLLRGRIRAHDQGRFEVHTVTPAPYQIPQDGPCGQLIAAAGWSAYRPAHLHLLVSAPGHQGLITQLYLAGDEHLDTDVAGAVKDELVLRPVDTDGRLTVSYDVVLAPAS